MKKSKQLIVLVAKLALFCVVGIYLLRTIIEIVSPRPAILGVLDGQLVDCPDSPNCVSSQANDYGHQIDPIRYTTSTPEAKGKLMSLLGVMSRVNIVTDQPNYVHAEFRTRLLHYIDDVEFYFDEQEKTIHIRSASRLGRSDLGANRTRVEEIKKHFYGAN